MPSKAAARKKAKTKKFPARHGKMTAVENKLVEALVVDAGPDNVDALQERAGALGLVLRRSKDAVRDAIIRAREKISANAEEYARVHLDAAKMAALRGDAGPSQWALERLTAPAEDGKGTERIIEPLASGAPTGPTGPVINIGVALGGMNQPKQLPKARVEVLPDGSEE